MQIYFNFVIKLLNRSNQDIILNTKQQMECYLRFTVKKEHSNDYHIQNLICSKETYSTIIKTT